MKIYISSDQEGVSGISTRSRESFDDQKIRNYKLVK
jgi:D-aminopeptidase